MLFLRPRAPPLGASSFCLPHPSLFCPWTEPLAGLAPAALLAQGLAPSDTAAFTLCPYGTAVCQVCAGFLGTQINILSPAFSASLLYLRGLGLHLGSGVLDGSDPVWALPVWVSVGGGMQQNGALPIERPSRTAPEARALLHLPALCDRPASWNLARRSCPAHPCPGGTWSPLLSCTQASLMGPAGPSLGGGAMPGASAVQGLE